MPDLTTEVTYVCQDGESWSTKVGDYTIAYNSHGHLNRGLIQYDYSCTCKAYVFGRGKHCKHIKQVIESGDRCTWDSDIGEEMEVRGTCPRCGEKTIAYRSAV
jgi:hypothetical protein